jgi:hypothetical protein
VNHRAVFICQLLSLIGIWIFTIGVTVWIGRLIYLARQLDDMPGGSVAISIVAIPVFWTGATVLTFVFVGLRRARARGGPEES